MRETPLAHLRTNELGRVLICVRVRFFFVGALFHIPLEELIVFVRHKACFLFFVRDPTMPKSIKATMCASPVDPFLTKILPGCRSAPHSCHAHTQVLPDDARGKS